MLDARNLRELVVRTRPKCIDGDRLAGEVIEFMQAAYEAGGGSNDLRTLKITLLARLGGDRLEQSLAGEIERRRRKMARPKSVTPAASVSATVWSES